MPAMGSCTGGRPSYRIAIRSPGRTFRTWAVRSASQTPGSDDSAIARMWSSASVPAKRRIGATAFAPVAGDADTSGPRTLEMTGPRSGCHI
jgi:hypothetical protein